MKKPILFLGSLCIISLGAIPDEQPVEGALTSPVSVRMFARPDNSAAIFHAHWGTGKLDGLHVVSGNSLRRYSLETESEAGSASVGGDDTGESVSDLHVGSDESVVATTSGFEQLT